jgi:hypothetical protein
MRLVNAAAGFEQLGNARKRIAGPRVGTSMTGSRVLLSNKSPCTGGGAAIRPRLAGVKPNSAEIRNMISAWRLAMAT